MKDFPTSMAISNWAKEDKPREKLLLKGRAALSDAELIAILIGSGTVSMSAVELSKNILAGADNNLNSLAKLSIKDLEKFKGIGEAKAISIIAALELGKRRKESEPTVKNKISCSKDIFEIMQPHLIDIPHEEFWIILLNRGNQVIKKNQISSGGIAGTVVDVRLIFKIALENLSNSMILIHNHPSGNLKPSQADIDLTKKLKNAGVMMDIPVLDHLIITEKKYYSFADEGIL